AALNILTGKAYMPSEAKMAAQIAAGAFIGCSVEKSDIIRLKYIFKPAIILLLAMLVLNLTMGFIIHAVSPLDLLTALMCAVPGGMSDIPLIAADMGVDAAKVTVMQFMRLLIGIGLFPSLIAMFDRKFGSHDMPMTKGARAVSLSKNKKADLLLTLCIAAVGGFFGKSVGMPAGILVFSMIFVIIFKLTIDHAYLPKWVKRLAQLMSGAYIGSSFAKSDLIELRCLIIPAIIIAIGYTANCIITGQILHRFCKIPLKEAMLAATPAGATDMALISSDLGVQSSDLIVLHIIRLVVVVSIFPQIINIIGKL
ncbi:MAG: AbrB family transcriptional regulator, partial [Oscillospiraceae bacterium]